jgi:type II secretory ATPase GspE/PulE/Tfp pilus assembly ATPase PilB-like protein/nucleotide-binding universal stress UspA family protein
MSQTILFPTDFSATSNAALRYAVSLARQSQAALLVVYVQPPSIPPRGTVEPPDDASAEDEAALLALLASVTPADPTPVSYEIRRLRGDPAQEIIRLAERERVDLIVMATAGRTGLRRMLMGSVAEAVAREAPCPVLALKEPFDAKAARVRARAGGESGAPPPGQEPVEFRDPASLLAEAGGSSALTLLEQAIDARATDIHIDPSQEEAEVRFRVDGRLEHYCRLHRDVAHPLVAQMKIMAEVDIADPFHPQEGRITLPDSLGRYEIRITTVPVIGGEAIALRLLSRQRILRPLDSLGLVAEPLVWLHDMLRLGEGVVLVTGPAGSGKTTTAYSMIHALDNGRRNIVTIEDPVEYQIGGFRQMSVALRHGITMTSGLRTLLRMDPDIVLVGEVRDAETAEIAMRAASSGKYVFTTLHTRDVASTITALRDLHIDNRSLAGNLTGIISQRLVRRVCSRCSRLEPTSAIDRQFFLDQAVEPPPTLAHHIGCAACRNLGYHERIGVFEVVLPNRAIREAIESDAAEEELRDLLRSNGTRSLLSDALLKVAEGVTTLDEVRGMTWIPFPG